MDSEQIKQYKSSLVKLVQLGQYPEFYAQIDELLTGLNASYELRESLDKQTEAYHQLQERIQAMEMPPLTEATLLFVAPDDPTHVIVGQGSQRIEVLMSPDSTINPDDLLPGAEVWLNKDHQIVKVRPSTAGGEVVEVLSVMGDNVEVKSHIGESMLLQVGHQIDVAALKPGDRLRASVGLRLAFEKLTIGSDKSLTLDDVPEETYDSVGGLDEAIDEIKEAIQYPYLYGQLFDDFGLERPKGILLYGPPGNGKTLIARAIANELSRDIERNLHQVRLSLQVLIDAREGLPVENAFHHWWATIHDDQPAPIMADEAAMIDEVRRFLTLRRIPLDDLDGELETTQRYIGEGSKAYFISIKGPELLNKYVGETEQSIRNLFLQAKRKANRNTPVVMFFDEIEALFRRRGSRMSSDIDSTIVPQFLSEIDGVEKLRDVIIIGATNRLELLDPAISRPGRLDVKIKIDNPTRDNAPMIVRKHLKENIPFDPDELALHGGDIQALIDHYIAEMVNILYDTSSSYVTVTGLYESRQSQKIDLTEFVSGAILAAIVRRAKNNAVKRQITARAQGMGWADIETAIRDEFESSIQQLVAQRYMREESSLTIVLNLAERGAAAQTAPVIVSPWLERGERMWHTAMLQTMGHVD